MKVAIIYNQDFSKVIYKFGMQNNEKYNPKTVKAVAKALEKGGHNVNIIDGNMHMIEELQDFMPQVVDGEQMGLVFNMAYGIQGESRYTHIPSMLEMLGIPYVGSTPAGHAMALDKVITKIIWQKHGIPTPKFWVFNSINDDMSDVEFPVIVKPKMESVSFGLKVVHNIDDLKESVKFVVDEFKQAVLVEQFIRGREFAVGLLGNSPVEAFPVLEIDLNNDPNAIQTLDDKKSKPRPKICPANIPEELAKKMQNISIDAFNALHLRDFARVDIRLDEKGEIHLLEINSMASLGESGSYLKAASAIGYNFSSLVNKMLDVAATRYFTMEEHEQVVSNTIVPLSSRIRGFLRGRQTQTEKFLEKIVNSNSWVRNVEGVNNIGAYLVKEFRSVGFQEKIYPQLEIGNTILLTNTIDDHYDVLFLDNIDTSERISDYEHYYATEQKIFGSGVWENKGGIAILLSAMRALKFTRRLNKKKIAILLTTDNSIKGKFSKGIVEKLSENATYTIGLKGAFRDGGLVGSRSGSGIYTCFMKMKKSNDAGDVSLTQSKFLQFVKKAVDQTNIEKGFIVSVANSKLEASLNEPFSHGEVMLSIRYQTLEDYKEFENKLKRLIPKSDMKLLNLHMEKGESRPAMSRTKEREELWKNIKSLSKKMGIRLLDEHRWSSSDICFVPLEKSVIDGMGPVGAKPKNNSEYILRHSLLERALLLAMTVHELN